METKRNSRIRRAIQLALGVGIASASMATPAIAADESAELEKVQVTGSRISRTQLEGAQPIMTITREEIEKTGLLSIGDILQEIPSAGSSINTNWNNGGNGGVYINLRNLGSQRVLVLVNGKRWVNGAGGGGVSSSVDLQTIPVSIIERVEVLKDGASAIYGSDAIAGVVNIITRDGFEGMEASAYYGAYDEGDGEQEFYDVSVGTASDRGSVFLSMSYAEQGSVMAGDRALSAEPIFGTGNTFGSTTTPMGRFRLPGIGGIFADATRDTVTDDPQLGDFRAFDTINDPYNFAPDNYLATPQERYNIYAQGRYKISEDVAFKADVLYNRRKSEQLLAAMPLTIGNVSGAITANGENVSVGANNPYNPFGVALDPDPVNGNMTAIQRRLVESGGRLFMQDVNTYRVSLALEGQAVMGGRYLDWDVSSIYADNQSRDMTQGLFDTTRIANALSDDCLADDLCVPLNLFGGVGSITPEMLEYISFEAHDNGGQEMRVLSGNISTDLVELPAGPLGVAIGMEHRRENGFDSPDALINAGNTTGNRRTSTEGGYKVKELYAEFAIPLLADVTFADSLEAQLAFRHSDYDTYGSTSTGKLGLRWQPTRDLLIRGTFSEGFRAPSISELYAGQSDSYPQLIDPCSDLGSESDQTIIDNCTSAGGPAAVGLDGGAAIVPADGSYVQGNTQVRISKGSNPNLLPETSETQTFGFVYSPSYLEGFSLAIDWYRIELEDSITELGPEYILDGCYAGGNAALCQLVSRSVTGELMDLLDAGFNIGSTVVEGADLNIAWNIGKVPGVSGSWLVNLDASYVDEYTDTVPGATPEDEPFVDKYAGVFYNNTGFPRWKANMGLTWQVGDFEVNWRSRYIHHQMEDCFDLLIELFGVCSDKENVKNKLGATTYHNAQVSYLVPFQNARVTFGVNNIGGKEPPISYSAFANSFDPSIYDLPGTFYYLRLSKRFE